MKYTEIAKSKIRTLIKVGDDLSAPKVSDLNSDYESYAVRMLVILMIRPIGRLNLVGFSKFLDHIPIK